MVKKYIRIDLAEKIKPKPPLGRLIREGDTGKKCSQCGSSLSYSLWPFKSKYCIQPKCENYYERN